MSSVVSSPGGVLIPRPAPDRGEFIVAADAAGGVNNAAAAIQAQIDAAEAAGGGVVVLPPGTFLINATLTIEASGVALVGAGFGTGRLNANYADWDPATVLKWGGAGRGTMLRIGNNTNPLQGVRLEGLGFDGNANASMAIYANKMQYSVIRQVGVRDLIAWGKAPLATATESPAITDPTETPTVVADGGGASGGALAAGVYSVRFSWTNAGGETLASPAASDFTVAAGNIPRVTLPALATNAVAARIYVTRAGEKGHGLYAVDVAPTTYDMAQAYDPAVALTIHTSASGTNCDAMGNLVEHFSAFNLPTALRLSGPSDHVSDVDFLTVQRLTASFTADGIDLQECDNNQFYNVHLMKQAGTGYGVRVRPYGRQNTFYGLSLSSGVGIYAETPGTTGWENIAFGYDLANSALLPTVEAGASFQVYSFGRLNAGWRDVPPILPALNGWGDFEDFDGGLTTSGSIGKGGRGLAGGTVTQLAATAGRVGLLTVSTGASANTYTVLYQRPGAVAVFLPGEFFEIDVAVKVNQADADTLMRVGIGDAITTNPPTNGIYFERLAADTNWFAVTRAAGSENRADMGVAMDTNWARFRIRRISASSIGFQINNGPEVVATLTIPTNGVQWFVAINNASGTKTYAIDWVRPAIHRLAR